MKNRNEFHKYLIKNNYKIGIEIGSYKGEFAKYLLDNWDGYLYMVDVWRQLSKKEYNDFSNQENPKEILLEVLKNLSGYEERTMLIRTDSYSATRLFPDEFFDFIYIDANHRYKYVIQDLKNWYPKLKVGGLMAGHDWISDYNENHANEEGDVHVWMYNIESPNIKEYAGLFGVNKAVKEFCTSINIKPETTTDEYFKTWYFRKV